MADRKPRRTPRREADRQRPRPAQPVCWPMLHTTSPEFLMAYTAYVDATQDKFGPGTAMSAGMWYGVMLGGFGNGIS